MVHPILRSSCHHTFDLALSTSFSLSRSMNLCDMMRADSTRAIARGSKWPSSGAFKSSSLSPIWFNSCSSASSEVFSSSVILLILSPRVPSKTPPIDIFLGFHGEEEHAAGTPRFDGHSKPSKCAAKRHFVDFIVEWGISRQETFACNGKLFTLL